MTTLREHDLRYLNELAQSLERLSEEAYDRQSRGEVGFGGGDDTEGFGFAYAARMVRKLMKGLSDESEEG